MLADVGVPATVEIVGRLEAEAAAGRLQHAPRSCATRCSDIVAEMLAQPARAPRDRRARRPAVMLVVGVNGTGKTTTIGKLAYRCTRPGASVVIGAADTFRAAAAEQLETWAERAAGRLRRLGAAAPTRPPSRSTPSAAGEARGRDVVIVDTAGRLHTQEHLMEELSKVRRVIAQRLPGRAARDAAHDRRDDRPERAAAGAPASRRPPTSPASC